MTERHHIEAAIEAQESLRGVVPDDVVDTAVDALRRQLVELDGLDEQRRQITVLFADVSGFTAMSASLDAEDLAGLMNDLWRRLDGEVTRFGGRIDKHMGDAVMALWGTAHAQEDDVERAVRAGIALLEALAAFRAETGETLSMRVGINTGRALVGAVGTTNEITAMGDTVNLASRLEHAAPVGSVLISRETYRHVRGVFDVEELPPLRVRGKAEPVRTYVVQRAKPRAFRIPSRGIEGIETSTIGREAELFRLQQQFDTVLAGGGARRVVVLGEAGVGKSRLLFELESWLELRPERIWLLKGRGLQSTRTSTLGLLRDVFVHRFGVLDSDVPDVVADKLRSGFAAVLTPTEADTVGRWFGFDLGVHGLFDSEGLSGSACADLHRWLAWLVADAPAVLLLEDVHWADPDSLEAITDLVDRLSDTRLMVVALARPDLVESDTGWFAATTGCRIDLSPLAPAATEQLVREVLQRADDAPDAFVSLIADRSDGNPFFVEELVKMFAEHEVISTSGPGGLWSVAANWADIGVVPPTLNDVLQARLDHLDPSERSALQCASVVGRVFWDAAVDALDDSGDRRSALQTARRRELIYRRDHSTFVGCDEFIFKHALLRDVTYETVLLRDRQRLHGRAAAWLTVQAGERLGEYLETIAEHHRLAGEHEDAARRLAQSAKAALERGFVGPARRAFEEAAELWSRAGHEVPADSLACLADACRRAGDFDAADVAVAAAIQRAMDPAELVSALIQSSGLAFDRGDPAGERPPLERAAELTSTDDPLTRAKVLRWLASWESRHGDLNAAQDFAEQALASADLADSLLARISAVGMLGQIAGTRGDLDRSVRHCVAAAELAAGCTDLSVQAYTLGNLGVAIHLRADSTGSTEGYAAAVSHYEAELRIRDRLGDRMGAMTTMANLAQARTRLGDTAGARTAARLAIAAAADIGAVHNLVFALLIEADRRLTQGSVDSALQLLGLVRAHSTADHYDGGEIERILSRTPLDKATIAAGMDAGEMLDLDEVVADLLAQDDG